MSAPPFQRALVIRGGALGDFLLTLPVLAALREAAPQSRLAVLAYPGIAELARLGGMVDEVRSIEYGPLAGFFTRGATLDAELREFFGSFDVVLSYLYDPDGFFADNLQAAGVKKLLRGPHRPTGRTHAIDELAAPLAELGVPLATRAVRLRVPGDPAPTREVFLHPGSGRPAKNWPAENWLSLGERLLESEADLQLTIVGGESDSAPLALLRPLANDPRVRFWENRPLPELAGALAGGLAYLGHDTGVSHLAAACGCPSLLLFGPTDPGVWAPPHADVRILRAPEGVWDALPVETVATSALRLVALASAARGRNTSA